MIRRFYDLATVGDQACWDLWHQEAVSKAPPDFPESRSGAAFRKQAAVVYTVRDGKIVRAEHFMDRSVARETAGL